MTTYKFVYRGYIFQQDKVNKVISIFKCGRLISNINLHKPLTRKQLSEYAKTVLPSNKGNTV